MPNPKPAPFNFTPSDPTGTTWALPEEAIGRLAKGVKSESPNRTYAFLKIIEGLES